ncbi:DUF3244 domain-containing protein [Bacteroides sp. ET489]|jgi:hypothetical protein|uniref:DUF3244 domain-containing protein n=2 Tax=Bacteroides TaxID=816 RepID=UPI0023F63B70|nr:MULTISPECIES: DUF3244 domain-containing protein [Bacteroides]MDO3390735.1 DUF3244 domain-containing protein [Bacteroides sp. ET489]
MKTKLVMALLMVFFVTPMSEAAQYAKRKSTRFNFASCNDKLVTRVPIDYNIEVTEGENYLQILFLFPLQDANITVTDCNGNVIIENHQVNSQEGKALYLYTPQAYPYALELTSSLVDIKGEITSEE